ncbi:eukaryotic translation initiation factor 3 subunit K [Schistocerca americana]|uniref:eukaryotic translation initiation factor 3 subunit K n=1 Tax=Schistocerca americana TaxID=7009 RepID=UPI001F4F13EF|nr:eukaryotic translation initiation factor 3 subunit K [Schistocerca americana]XP_047120115.1 eukaryotic translation initiation factor 3 subunit K [Schistocerca piceifrons]XP_049940281.1 eukaryotic translation initiation factor 3 subunit K [Schistocerca serialis cubense]
MAEAMRQTVGDMLKGVDRYNPENLPTLERYVEIQSRENAYDLEANLAVLKLYQLNPYTYNPDITCQILLKALTNFPHTDFILCKCLLNSKQLMQSPLSEIMRLADILECCDFQRFWHQVLNEPEITSRITGFNDSIRKFVCHVVGITFQTIDKKMLSQLLGGVDETTLMQWVKKYGWKEEDKDTIFIANQDENIKTKNITEKIDFESAAAIMAASR